MSGHEGLEPPHDVHVEDPGAHQLAESSDSDDQFTDAQSGPMSPSQSSPIPKTRVERIDNEPSYGEVPGTDAYKAREGDAAPDEIAVLEDPSVRSASSSSHTEIPSTVVEESSGQEPVHHSKEYEESRKADATPDLVLGSDGEVKGGEGNSTTDAQVPSPVNPGRSRSKSSRSLQPIPDDQGLEEEDGEDNDDDDNDDDFGDDFDDFEEGAAQDEDFDDFEDGFQQAHHSPPPPPAQIPTQQATLPFPIPDFDGLSPDEVMSATDPYLSNLFRPEDLEFAPLPPLSKDSSIFLTSRSASLWSQLVAPPPLAPPDWIRSRTRRLFLVSLGVPVDLDEILPASKQKKLVLPSLNIPTTSPRTSSDSRSVSRLRQGERNASSTSVDTQGKPSTSKRRKGASSQPELDMVAARHLCMTTDEALSGMTNEELKTHVGKLEAMEGTAKEVLEYWKKRTDEKIGDREAFEGVIENLVKHARKVRK